MIALLIQYLYLVASSVWCLFTVIFSTIILYICWLQTGRLVIAILIHVQYLFLVVFCLMPVYCKPLCCNPVFVVYRRPVWWLPCSCSTCSWSSFVWCWTSEFTILSTWRWSKFPSSWPTSSPQSPERLCFSPLLTVTFTFQLRIFCFISASQSICLSGNFG